MHGSLTYNAPRRGAQRGGIMENLESVWQFSIIALFIGLAAGILIQRLLNRSSHETEDLRQARDAAQQELEQYRASVNQHFDKTSELVNDLTQDYVRVYQHLAEGAQTLGNSKTLNNLLEQQPGRVSIALDENTQRAPGVAPETVVPAAAEPADEHADAFNADPAPAAAADVAVESDATDTAEARHGETDSTATRQADSAPDEEAQKAEATGSDAPPKTAASTDSEPAAEPVLNVDALDDALEKTGDAAKPAPARPEETDKREAATTTH